MLAALAAILAVPSPAAATVLPSDWTCQTYSWYLGRNLGDSSYVIAPPADGVYSPIDAAGDSITLASADGIVWYWTSTALIRGIMIRADVPGTALGDATNQLWLYASPSGGGSYSSAIYTEDSAGTRYPAKYVEFCFDAPPTYPGLQITKTAEARYTATYDWTIQKTTPVGSLLLSSGQSVPVAYQVSVSRAAATASDFEAFGQIVIHNPAPVAATLTGVSDAMEGGAPVATDCHVAFPFTLAAGGNLVCDWTASLPDSTTRTDTATVTTTGPIQGGSATAAVSFVGVPPTTVVDACVDVTDDRAGTLGKACEPMSFQYVLTVVGPAACGDSSFTNTATFVAVDSGATGSSSVTIPITVPCAVGCTLTPGYWKTHSKYGPAPYDDAWAQIGEDTPFFKSGTTWYGQFAFSPVGNAYWILAHAYAAAALNVVNGASAGAVAVALADGRSLLETYAPADIAGLKGSSALRLQFVQAAAALDAWYNGLAGPGHCSE